MSLFKAREWWCTTVGENEFFDLGCLCVADITSTRSDQIIVGSYHGRLAMYQPHPTKMDEKTRGFSADDLICELQMSSPVLQIASGRFASASESLKLAVLQPRKLTVFAIAAMPGVTEHGAQYQLHSVYEHKLQRTAFNFCWGPFGGVKGKDFICVQSMDGTISVFEQESFSFSRFLPGTLLPGPIGYVAKTDSIVTVASSRQVDCFKFRVLAMATDDQIKEETQNIKSGRRVTADWSFLINEAALDLVVTTFDTAPLAIMVLGERNLYALSEAGQLLFMKKFNFSPLCFLPYSGSSGNIRYMVVTHTQSLLVYENMTLKWAAQMTLTPVQIRVGGFKGLKGVTVALTEDGRLSCSYLGTDPSMMSHPSAYLRELDYASVEAEMKQLQRIIKEHQSKFSIPTPSQSSDEDVRLSVDVPSTLDKVSKAVVEDIEDDVSVPSITVTVSLQAKCAVHNVKLTCNAVQPLVVLNATTVISSVFPGQPVDTQVTVFMKPKSLPSDLMLTVLATYYTNAVFPELLRNRPSLPKVNFWEFFEQDFCRPDPLPGPQPTAMGAPKVAQTTSHLPLSVVLRPCMPVKSATYKITVDTNKSPVNLGDLFSDLWGVDSDTSANVVGFKYYGLSPVISLLASKSSQRYRIQCDSFAYMWYVIRELVTRLASRFKMGSSSDFRIYYDSPLPLQEYFEIIDQHFECRCKNDAMMKQLDEHVTQFRATQKRILILFKDKTPTSLKNLDVLLDSSFKQIMALADDVETNNKHQQSLSAELSCATRVITLLIRLWLNLCPADVSAFEAALTSVVNGGTKQGWEETVDASVTHLLRTNLSKNATDAAMNPAPLGIPKDTKKLKKHIALVCDRLGKGAKLTEGSASGNPVRNHSSVDNIVKKKESSDVLTDKNGDDDWTVNENSHAAFSKAPASDVSLPFSDTEISRSKRLPELASGEPSRDNHELHLAAEEEENSRGARDFRKKSNKAVDSDPNLDDTSHNEDLDGALYSGNNELVYGL